MDAISFIASLPTNRDVVKIDGEGETKLVMVVPESELDAMLIMARDFRGIAFRVTIVPTDLPAKDIPFDPEG